ILRSLHVGPETEPGSIPNRRLPSRAPLIVAGLAASRRREDAGTRVGLRQQAHASSRARSRPGFGRGLARVAIDLRSGRRVGAMQWLRAPSLSPTFLRELPFLSLPPFRSGGWSI